MKKLILVALMFSSFATAQEAQVVPFGFSQTQIKKETVKAKNIVNNASLKRMVVISGLVASAGYFIFRMCYKHLEWLEPGTVLAPVFDKSGQIVPGKFEVVGVETAVSLGWLDRISKMAKTVTEYGGEFAGSYLIHKYGDPMVNRYLSFFDNTWFLNKETDINSFRQSISEDVILLPTVDQESLIEQRVAVIEQKIEFLMTDLMKFFGYLIYRQKEELKEDTLCAVRMKNVIEFLQTNTENFCNDFKVLLDEYAKGPFDDETRAQKGSRLETTLLLFFDTLYADIKTFDLYENKKEAKA